jgi:hypothetical protein
MYQCTAGVMNGWCMICGKFVVGDCNVWVVVHIASWCDRVCNITSTVLELNKMQGWIMVMFAYGA